MACNPTLRDRETRGVIKSSKRFIVPQEMIESMKARPPHEFGEGKPDVLYTGIDPSGGGAGSDYVIVCVGEREKWKKRSLTDSVCVCVLGDACQRRYEACGAYLYTRLYSSTQWSTKQMEWASSIRSGLLLSKS